MSLKNLNVLNKTHKFLLNKLKDKRVFNIYKKFESFLSTQNINEDFIVSVSGGSDSLALTFLSKIYSIKNSLNPKYFIIDHRLRKDSSLEANKVKKQLNRFSITSNILNWNGKKPKKNIQSIARNKRYKLLLDKAKKYKIKYILVGHHLDDLYENFFIRITRGSGLKGLISLDKISKTDNFYLIRPLLDINKKDLIYISNYIFGSYIKDPSNKDDKFKRVRIRNFLKQLQNEGLDENKFHLTIKNLKSSNETINYYIKKNLEENVTFFKKKQSVVLKKNFFHNSTEVIFRSLIQIISLVGKRHYPARGKKIDTILKLIYSGSQFKVTLGKCVIKKINKTVIVSKEQ